MWLLLQDVKWTQVSELNQDGILTVIVLYTYSCVNLTKIAKEKIEFHEFVMMLHESVRVGCFFNFIQLKVAQLYTILL